MIVVAVTVVVAVIVVVVVVVVVIVAVVVLLWLMVWLRLWLSWEWKAKMKSTRSCASENNFTSRSSPPSTNHMICG